MKQKSSEKGYYLCVATFIVTFLVQNLTLHHYTVDYFLTKLSDWCALS